MTNAIPLIQLAAQHAGYNVSTGEVAAICALGGAVVHIAHQAVAAYGRAGGWQGVIRFLKAGNSAAGDRPTGAPLTGPIGK